jgi:predicted nucleotidyltransferase
VFQKLLKKTARGLSSQNIPYMVVGGQAILLYGEPRLTKDIDITLGIGIDGLDKIKRVVESLNLRSLISDVDSFVQETMVFPVIDEKSGIRVDFIFSFSHYEKQAIDRANEIELGNAAVKFAALEDVIIHKIIAARARDLEDIRSILLKKPDYDVAYIEKWLKEFDKSLDEDFGKTFKEIVAQLKKNP